jgi:small nuclear ribonucleoprotein (snRNP)-like protein
VNGEEKPIAKKAPPQFISKLIGKKIVIRLLSGGQPISGVLEAYNAYEILL